MMSETLSLVLPSLGAVAVASVPLGLRASLSPTLRTPLWRAQKEQTALSSDLYQVRAIVQRLRVRGRKPMLCPDCRG